MPGIIRLDGDYARTKASLHAIGYRFEGHVPPHYRDDRTASESKGWFFAPAEEYPVAFLFDEGRALKLVNGDMQRYPTDHHEAIRSALREQMTH